ncbi:hypothetical protein DMH88_11660 [Escherichia coli]|nr:hypothetical protein [Escherichia coli]
MDLPVREAGYNLKPANLPVAVVVTMTGIFSRSPQITWMNAASEHTEKNGTKVQLSGDGNIQSRLASNLPER